MVFEVTVNAIEEETTPEWNDEFVQANTEYDSVDAYMEGTRTSLQEQKDSQKEYYVMQAIVDDSEFACADSDIQSLVDTKTKQYESYASMYGMELADFLSAVGVSEDSLKEDAQFQVQCALVIDAIAKAENMTISDEEYQTGLEDLAKQYSADSAEDFEEQYGKDEVVNSLLYDKVLDYVAEQAVVK